MSLSDLDVKQLYTGNGSTQAFAIPHALVSSTGTSSTEVAVYLVDETVVPATETLQTLTTHYTLTGGPPVTTVNMLIAPTASQKLLIKRAIALTQPLTLSTNGPYPAASHELALDRLIAQIQLVDESTKRAVKFRQSSALVDIKLPDPILNRLLKWNATADALENSTVDDIALMAAAAAALASELAAAASAAAAAVSASNANASDVAADASEAAAAVSAAAAAASALAAAQDTLGYQEFLGTGNGAITSFGGLLYTPISEDAILVFRNYTLENKANWSLSGANIVFSTAPVLGQKIYVWYMYRGTAVPIVPPAGTEILIYPVLSAGDIASKSYALPVVPASASRVMLDIVGSGSPQVYGTDFTVSGGTIDWTGYALDGVLVAGNQFRLHYWS